MCLAYGKIGLLYIILPQLQEYLLEMLNEDFLYFPCTHTNSTKFLSWVEAYHGQVVDLL